MSEELMLQAHDALEAAREKMRGAVEPDDVRVYEQVNSALYALRSRRPLPDAGGVVEALVKRLRAVVPIIREQHHRDWKIWFRTSDLVSDIEAAAQALASLAQPGGGENRSSVAGLPSVADGEPITEAEQAGGEG